MADRALNLARVAIDRNTAATHLVLAGQAGYDIVVVGAVLSANNDQQATLQDASGTNLLSMHLREESGPAVLPEMDGGWLRCTTGENLNIVLTAGVATVGTVVYRLVPSHFEF